MALAEAQEQLAWAVLGVVLVAGLPPCNIEAAADGEETGVALVPDGHGAPVHPTRVLHLTDAEVAAWASDQETETR